MNGAHWHLVLNHFPFIGGLIASLLLIGGYFFKSQSVKTSGLILILFTGLISIPVLNSGEEAEEVLAAIGQQNKDMIHPHEEAAESAFWVMEVAAVAALVSLVLLSKKRVQARPFIAITLVISLIATGLMMNVNNLGGKIRHTEIRP